jgi:rod shape determining protein RodA
MIRPQVATLWPRGTDIWLWLAVGLLVPLSVAMVHSAALVTRATQSGVTDEAVRQGAYAAAGLIAMVTTARFDYRWLRRGAPAVYSSVLLALAAVLVVGIAEHGARRWLGAGGLTVQPSEFAKLALAVALAAYGAARQPRLQTALAALCLGALPAGLVVLQPDLGTVIVLTGVALVVLVAWGLSWRVLLTFAATGAALIPLAFIAVPAYQRERLAVFFDPDRDPLGSGFNLRQVELALGTAGVTGHGLFSGAQSHLDAVAARSSDFMFGFVGAELGALGALGVLLLLGLVVTRGLLVASRAPDTFGRLLAVGLTAIVLIQGAVNVAVNLRLFPVTGIPLPFISQGGSSLFVMLIAAGLLQSIAARRPTTTAERWKAEQTR